MAWSIKLNLSCFWGKQMTHNRFGFTKLIRFSLVVSILSALLLVVLAGIDQTSASNPSGGTINPTTTSPLTWIGSGTGGGALNAPLDLIAPEALFQRQIRSITRASIRRR